MESNMITLHWSTLVFIVVIIPLIYLSFKDYSDGGGSYMDMSGLYNIFWVLVSIIFVAIWGGIFWW